jgi:hypothetical protein
MLAELQSMNRAGYGLAGSKGAGDVLQSLRAGTKVVAGGMRDIQGESQDFRKGTDKVLLENIDAVNKAMSGEGSLNDVLKTATTSVGGITTALKDNFTVAITNAKDEMDKFSKSGNMFAGTLKASYDASLEYIEKHEKMDLSAIKTETKKPEIETTETPTVKVKDFYIATLPEDKLVMAGGTNLDGNNQTQNNSPTELNVKVDLNVSAPPNIDTSQLLAMFKNDIRIQQAIVDATQEAYSSGGGASPNNPNAKNKSIVNRAIGMYNE